MKYVCAQSAADALQALLGENGKALLIAGGSDLMVEMKEGRRKPEALVDVSFASDMKRIVVMGNELVIGAAVTFAEIAKSPDVKGYFPSLCYAAGRMGSPQIRNLATLGGNVVSAQPAADGAIALTPLDPRFVVLSAAGARTLPISELYAGIGRSALDPSREIVKEIRIPLPAADEAASFIRLELRRTLSLPILNVAAMLKCSGGKVQWARIAMGPVGPGPTRATEAEGYLVGKTLTKANAAKAGDLALLDAKPRSNPLRGSKEYREQVLPVLVRRAIEDIAGQLGTAI